MKMPLKQQFNTVYLSYNFYRLKQDMKNSVDNSALLIGYLWFIVKIM